MKEQDKLTTVVTAIVVFGLVAVFAALVWKLVTWILGV